MAENSNIEWTDHTFNPWIGCQKVSPGCDHCYAEARDRRFTGGALWGPHAPRRRTSQANWRAPLRWNRAAAKAGKRARVFCASLADVFDNHASIQQEWRDDLWTLIYRTPHLDWLLLTKRPQNIARYMPPAVENGGIWPNVWLGTTVENQTEADRRIPHLLAVPARVRFLSCEPLLGPVDLRPYLGAKFLHQRYGLGAGALSWVICGGESGPGARPMHPDWARSLRDQCQAAGVAFHFKQWGEWGIGASRDTRPEWTVGDLIEASTVFGEPAWIAVQDKPWSHLMENFGKRAAGRLLDGRTWDEVPGGDNG